MTVKTAVIGVVAVLTVVLLMPTAQYFGLMLLIKLGTTLGIL